jgi:hypothetical protein
MVTGMTPNIIEERSLNVAVMDVYSRLMMDRIIFLGYPINDEIANIVTAQLLFLDSTHGLCTAWRRNKGKTRRTAPFPDHDAPAQRRHRRPGQ